ncbi:MAG: hypothetical protein O7C98_06340, partial [Planctomycetota bacterium]|nr:hypothetical protein [Planctomycetota bacterium]
MRSDSRSRRMPPTLGRLFVAVLLLTATAFTHPARGIVIDKKGRVCFLGPAFRVCRIEPDAEPDGKLTRTGTGGVSPHHLAIDSAGNLYFEGWLPTQLSRLAPNGKLTAAYPPEGKRKGNAYLGGGVQCPFLVDSKGAIYFVETRAGTTNSPKAPGSSARRQPPRAREWCRIMKVTPEDSVSVVAGSKCGHADGKGEKAQFRRLDTGTMAWGPNGTIYVTDAGTCVRRVELDGTVTTLAVGTEEGYGDGKGSAARFKWATGLAVDTKGNVYVVDHGN